MTCKTHPDAPHGFDRNGSHSEDRYVCMCESWEPPQPRALVLADALERMDTFTEYQRGEILKAAAELCRLYESNEQLREQNTALDAKLAESEALLKQALDALTELWYSNSTTPAREKYNATFAEITKRLTGHG
jgi:hypothetical protein